MKLELTDFSYNLPDHLVAQEPLLNRCESRLLVRYSDGTLLHRKFQDLSTFLKKGTVVVYNDSRVIPGRILTQTQSGGKLEFMLLKPTDSLKNTWIALGKPFRKLKPGLEIKLDSQLTLSILKVFKDGVQPSVEITFNQSFDHTVKWLEVNGFVPLPPYIERKNPLPANQSTDKERYQTVYAKHIGSVAAPTAGLHFTPELWEKLRLGGVETVPLTLHVGGGTFLPVKSQDISQHEMHSELYQVSRNSWERIREAEREKRSIVCVGTTSLRCLESFARKVNQTGTFEDLVDKWHETKLFIYPENQDSRVKPWGVNAILTNFHQPESSLLMLISALIGYQETKDLYECAIKENYRFFSYGDASLLWL